MSDTLTFILWGLAVLLLALVIYGFWIEPAMRLRTVRWSIKHEKWNGRAPLRIVIISDLHAGAPHIPLRRVSRIVRRANALNPDLAILLGDYAAAHNWTLGKMTKAQIIDRLKPFTSPLGTYSVLGNHDWWQDDKVEGPDELPEAGKALEAAGIPLLENASVELRDGPDRFLLAGLADQRPRSLDPEVAGFDDLEAALDGTDPDLPVVLLAHEPDIFPDIPDRCVVTISGHTHGGQIMTFGFSPVIMAAETETWCWGRYDGPQGQVLVVSGGIGCSDIPVRVGVPPEITVIEISGED